MDYIDFIDSSAIRDHLRTLPPLPPAQQCILIAQSEFLACVHSTRVYEMTEIVHK